MKRYVSLIVCVAVAVCVGALWANYPPRFAWPREGEQPKAFVHEAHAGEPAHFDLCISRHATTRCYGGAGRPWSRVVVDAMKGFR